jgi:hypothetical protein
MNDALRISRVSRLELPLLEPEPDLIAAPFGRSAAIFPPSIVRSRIPEYPRVSGEPLAAPVPIPTSPLLPPALVALTFACSIVSVPRPESPFDVADPVPRATPPQLPPEVKP